MSVVSWSRRKDYHWWTPFFEHFLDDVLLYRKILLESDRNLDIIETGSDRVCPSELSFVSLWLVFMTEGILKEWDSVGVVASWYEITACDLYSDILEEELLSLSGDDDWGSPKRISGWQTSFEKTWYQKKLHTRVRGGRNLKSEFTSFKEEIARVTSMKKSRIFNIHIVSQSRTNTLHFVAYVESLSCIWVPDSTDRATVLIPFSSYS